MALPRSSMLKTDGGAPVFLFPGRVKRNVIPEHVAEPAMFNALKGRVVGGIRLVIPLSWVKNMVWIALGAGGTSLSLGIGVFALGMAHGCTCGYVQVPSSQRTGGSGRSY